jgi:hypothetical protein
MLAREQEEQLFVSVLKIKLWTSCRMAMGKCRGRAGSYIRKNASTITQILAACKALFQLSAYQFLELSITELL